jgi:hypothetical protein
VNTNVKLVLIIAALAGVFAVGGICNFGRVYLMRVSGQNITAALRNNVCTYYFYAFFGVCFGESSKTK